MHMTRSARLIEGALTEPEYGDIDELSKGEVVFESL